MPQIIPAIIAKTKEEFEEMIHEVEPYVDRVHLDIMDGNFVNNKTISGYEELLVVNTKLKFDVHLMVDRPEDQMFYWYKTGAERFLIHAETDHGHKVLIDQVHNYDKKIGVVLNPETQIEKIAELINDLDFVQFMTIHPGAYGGDFLEEVVYKIEDFHAQFPSMLIGVDGGVRPQTIPRLLAAGVSDFVSGSFIFSNPDAGKAITELQKAVQG